ncbi:hypothetical protein B0H13DRAFT_1893937 [Mycena leptocephala]|nr:hypothetical protein B0H13DRAFT_1893937 [Mycena leptocephala]
MIRWTASPLFFLFVNVFESSAALIIECPTADEAGNRVKEADQTKADVISCTYSNGGKCVYDFTVTVSYNYCEYTPGGNDSVSAGQQSSRICFSQEIWHTFTAIVGSSETPRPPSQTTPTNPTSLANGSSRTKTASPASSSTSVPSFLSLRSTVQPGSVAGNSIGPTSKAASPTPLLSSVVSVGFLVAVAILFFWVRRRRQRIDGRRLPEQFVDQEGLISQANLRLKNRSIAAPDHMRQTNAPRVGAENGALFGGLPEDSPSEETVNLRLRRVEAQLEALVTMVAPEGSPPSYTS